MTHHPRLIIQVPGGGAIARQLSAQPPADVVIDVGPTDAEGNLEPPAAGEVVLSVPSPEALAREAGEVRRVIAHGPAPGVEPLVILVEAAEELRDDELAVVLDAADDAPRAVILRVARNV